MSVRQAAAEKVECRYIVERVSGWLAVLGCKLMRQWRNPYSKHTAEISVKIQMI